MLLNRRNFAQALLVAPTMMWPGCSAQGATIPFLFGAALRADQLENRRLMRLAAKHCRSFTPENELKWDFVEWEEGKFNLQPINALVDFAFQKNMRMRGHTLIWHRAIPMWAHAKLMAGADWQVISRFIERVVPKFDGIVDEWDVINEPLDPVHGIGGLRASPFFTAFGQNYIPRALSLVRTLAPKARLYINEYGLIYATSENRARREALIRLVDWIREIGAPIDGIGIQAHLDLCQGPFDSEEFGAFLDALAARGLQVTISELDVKECDYALPVKLRDMIVATRVAQYLDVALSRSNVTGITTWGLSDSVSWLSFEPQDRLRFPDAWRNGRSPGLNRGLPFDSDCRAKPMWREIVAAIRKHRPTSHLR